MFGGFEQARFAATAETEGFAVGLTRCSGIAKGRDFGHFMQSEFRCFTIKPIVPNSADFNCKVNFAKSGSTIN